MSTAAQPPAHLRPPRYRIYRGVPLHPSEEAFMFFEDRGPVPETLRAQHESGAMAIAVRIAMHQPSDEIFSG
jgi:hypothetical protein